MATINNLPFSTHVEYAKRIQLIESVNEQFRVSESQSIPAQMSVVNSYPRAPELDMLLGDMTSNAPWAFFVPPRKFYSQRRPSFISYRAAPSLGTIDEQSADYAKLQAYRRLSEHGDEGREEREGDDAIEQGKQALCSCFEQIDEINAWKGHILGRIAQFLAG